MVLTYELESVEKANKHATIVAMMAETADRSHERFLGAQTDAEEQPWRC